MVLLQHTRMCTHFVVRFYAIVIVVVMIKVIRK